MKRISIFAIVFFLVLLYPLFGGLVDKKFELFGVTGSEETPVKSVQGIMDGSYQSGVNTWVENHFPGRNLMIWVRSQLSYSLLNESANANVLIGKDEYLFEPHYISRELGIAAVEDENYFPLP